MKGQEFKFNVCGGELVLIIYSNDHLKKIAKEFYSEALRLEKIFNFFDRESELSELNKKRKLNISNELLEVIKEALKLSWITNGQYDVSLGKTIMQRKGRMEEDEMRCSYKDIIIKGNVVILKNKSVNIDLGSIAKGYITDKLGKFLINRGIKEFVIDSRGDILFSGDYEHVIGVQHPRKNKRLLNIKMKNKAIATSGDYHQFYGTFDKSHIVNQKDLISLTVIAENLTEADVYATALFVVNEKTREKILRKKRNIKVLSIDKNLKNKMYNNFQEAIYER